MTKDHKETLGSRFTGNLQLLFVAFKLAHIISWSWWLVLLPSLIPIGLYLAGAGLDKLIAILDKKAGK